MMAGALNYCVCGLHDAALSILQDHAIAEAQARSGDE